ncbi:hypothetical protein PM10SUCC1_25020 [Propionigenium maris DSM 9537]|uniref:Uncharacterized protein n=1 Tax=Propionigenium maris DSM 9537 TaxID=1123000 RepID=A0A9W6LNV1_9FUSO|nr:hypothetical protein [Propionigenium maris]GLI56988.1 hypothetical protein PM10SUCC1_25020 [Propionigenium maris DSM 9537]
MKDIFSVMTDFNNPEDTEELEKYIYILHKGKVVCLRLFEEIENIREFLVEVYEKILRETPGFKEEGRLNFIYFNWLEDKSRKEEEMEKEFARARKNIYVSRAISKLQEKSQEYINFLEIFEHKYTQEAVKAALRELYMFNREIKDIKGLTAALIIKNYHL